MTYTREMLLTFREEAERIGNASLRLETEINQMLEAIEARIRDTRQRELALYGNRSAP